MEYIETALQDLKYQSAMKRLRNSAMSMNKSVDKHKTRRFDYVFRKLRTQAQKFESRSSTASKMGDKRRA